MAKPTMIAFSVGVADDVLLEIGRLVVLGAQIDYHRMRLLEVMANTPIAESANIPISRLTGRLKSAAAEPPFDRIRDDLRH